jgi:antitoxin HicB
MLRYPVRLEPDTNGTIRVDFPDVPEAHTFGQDNDKALVHAVDALESALMLYIEDRRSIPRPSPVKRKRHSVAVPALAEARLALYSAMRSKRISKTELAKRLNCQLPQVDRLLDLRHSSQLEHLEAAFRALGKELSVQILDAA